MILPISFCRASLPALLGATADVQVSDVFVGGKEGYHTYRIPAVVVTTNRTVLAFCEGRKYGRSDSGEIDLLLKRSRDGGRTWADARIVWSDAKNTCGNPAPVVDSATGDVLLLMTWNRGSDTENQIASLKSQDTRHVFLTRGTDDGKNWSKPRDITSSVKKRDWGWYATGPVNGIQLTRGAHAGRLLIPCNHTELEASGRVVTRAHVIFSDDHGETWQLGGIEEEKTNESTIVELADGSILHNMRSYHQRNRRAVATSQDGGISWSAVKLDDALIEPVCQGSLLRCAWPDGGEKSRILFANPASTRREKLTVRASFDEGATWPAGREICPGPSGYSCMAMLPDKSVGCLFERGERTSTEKISFARFTVDLVEGKK
jgi:sialidase-1